MARKTPVTTVTKDSGASHTGAFKSAINKVRAPGEVDSRAGTTPRAIKNAQNEIHSYFSKDQDTGVHTALPTDTGLDTDTN